MEKSYIKKEEIGAILVTSFTPDYFVPQISNLIHREFDLPFDVFTADYWAGCSGYIKGLQQAFMVLEAQSEDKKVLLFTGDIANRVRSEKEMYDMPPYGGDAASITVLEKSEYDCEIPFMMKTKGDMKDLITFKQGAFSDLYHKGKNDSLTARASDAFRFFQGCIPELMFELADYAQINMDDIEHFFFIQANKLSVQKFSDMLKLDRDKVSMNVVEKYGDLSASLNPVSIVDYYGDKLLGREKHFVSICGYGSGAEWGGMFITLENLINCENIITDL
ncbi:MAG: hypothetical protein NC489_19225 [Ruminococcus flavefaciens]|nr:hypothetical protein [Ruminococcus flavefaciens]